MIGAIMLVVTLVLTFLRNIALGSGERRMTVARAIAQVVALLVLSYIVLAAIWWYDPRLVNASFDASRALIGQFAAAIDPGGKLPSCLGRSDWRATSSSDALCLRSPSPGKC